MFMLHKSRARKPLAMSLSGNVGYHYSGVGGIDGNGPVVSIQVGDYRLYITDDGAFENIYQTVKKLREEK